MSKAICKANFCKQVRKVGGNQVGANRIAQNKRICKASGGGSSEHLLPAGETGGMRKNRSNTLLLD